MDGYLPVISDGIDEAVQGAAAIAFSVVPLEWILSGSVSYLNESEMKMKMFS